MSKCLGVRIKTGNKRQELYRIEYEETFTSFCLPNYDTKS